METWKAVEGTKGMIEVSDQGRVRSLLRGTPYILKTQPDKKGYRRLRVTIDRQKYCFKLHRLVANAFIPNPDNLPQVNHIDGDKDNNAVSNLEWVTNDENRAHAIMMGLMPCSQKKYYETINNNKSDKKKTTSKKRIPQARKSDTKKTTSKTRIPQVRERKEWINPNPKKPVVAYKDNIIIKFDSISDAEIYFSSRHISDVCKGKREKVKGYRVGYFEKVR